MILKKHYSVRQHSTLISVVRFFFKADYLKKYCHALSILFFFPQNLLSLNIYSSMRKVFFMICSVCLTSQVLFWAGGPIFFFSGISAIACDV